MQYSYDRSFNFKINDDNWECYLITDEEATELDQKVNDSTDGFKALTLTKSDGRCLFIVEDSVTKNIINHELLHIFVSYLYIDSANITNDEFEEIIAEMFENDLDKFIRTRNKLYKKFKGLEGSS